MRSRIDCANAFPSINFAATDHLKKVQIQAQVQARTDEAEAFLNLSLNLDLHKTAAQ